MNDRAAKFAESIRDNPPNWRPKQPDLDREEPADMKPRQWRRGEPECGDSGVHGLIDWPSQRIVGEKEDSEVIP